MVLFVCQQYYGMCYIVYVGKVFLRFYVVVVVGKCRVDVYNVYGFVVDFYIYVEMVEVLQVDLWLCWDGSVGGCGQGQDGQWGWYIEEKLLLIYVYCCWEMEYFFGWLLVCGEKVLRGCGLFVIFGCGCVCLVLQIYLQVDCVVVFVGFIVDEVFWVD